MCIWNLTPQKMMESLGIGMKPGFITWSLSGPSELGSFHHIVKLCFVFRRCRMQPLSSRWETQLPWTSQRSDGCFPLGWWWLSGWMMLLFSPKNYDELEEPTPKSRRLRQVSGGCQRWSSADLEHMNPHGLREWRGFQHPQFEAIQSRWSIAYGTFLKGSCWRESPAKWTKLKLMIHHLGSRESACYWTQVVSLCPSKC